MANKTLDKIPPGSELDALTAENVFGENQLDPNLYFLKNQYRPAATVTGCKPNLLSGLKP